MIDSYIYIIDDLIFFCTGLLLLYLFVMAVASHCKHITYPKAQKSISLRHSRSRREAFFHIYIKKNHMSLSHTAIYIRQSTV